MAAISITYAISLVEKSYRAASPCTLSACFHVSSIAHANAGDEGVAQCSYVCYVAKLKKHRMNPTPGEESESF